jgi:uncharacterized membrane protein
MKLSALRPILVVMPVAWIAALGAATVTSSLPAVGAAAYGFSAAIYQVGSLLCHQLSERSFHFRGAQLPVCARCAGLYVGAAAAALSASRLGPTRSRNVWNRSRMLLAVAALPTAVTLIGEWFSGHMPSHWIRAAAGLPLGAIVMLIVLAATTPESVVEIH